MQWVKKDPNVAFSFLEAKAKGRYNHSITLSVSKFRSRKFFRVFVARHQHRHRKGLEIPGGSTGRQLAKQRLERSATIEYCEALRGAGHLRLVHLSQSKNWGQPVGTPCSGSFEVHHPPAAEPAKDTEPRQGGWNRLTDVRSAIILGEPENRE